MAVSKEVRFGDLHPPIKNCTGGLMGESLHGSLTPEQIAEVKKATIAQNLSDQEALPSTSECQHQGEVEFLYFPTYNPTRVSPSSERIIGALCAQTDCEYNTSKGE